MASRLDRLFVLLDTGSSPVTRKAAALQLGEVQKFHPHELHNLLAKVRSYLQSNQWETRIAAGQAIEAIVKNVPLWEPSKSRIIKTEDTSHESNCQVSMSGRMKFEKFDINEVLNRGSCLLASAGKEFEIDDDEVTDEKEKLARQRQLLNKRLGLDMAEKMGMDTLDIYSNEDLIVSDNHQQKSQKQNEITKKAIAEIFQAEMAQIRSGLSSREVNKAKRKAKLIAKQKSRENQEASSFANSSNNEETEEPEAKKRKKVKVENVNFEDARVGDNLILTSNEDLTEWPFETFCDQLSQDLFSASWEIRHGAATALREIIKVHGKGAGCTADATPKQSDDQNQYWLEDMALRLLCVLGLDRFGDFIADQVVAPVRETCAQSMAAVLNLMNEISVRGVTHVLLQLLQQKEWEARHGGLLGMKYLLAVRKEMTVELLPVVFTPIFQGLKDEVDDVCAVAAAALVPVVDEIVNQLPDKVPGLIATLWDLLLDQDDLTTSTNSVMSLLASLLSYPNSSTHYFPTEPLNQLIPRLWPFLSHSSSSVRKSALKTLNTLASANKTQPEWLAPILSDALRHIFQRCILEHVQCILDLIHVLWKQLVSICPLDLLLASACPSLSIWFCLMMQPSKIPFPPEMLVEAKYKGKEKSAKSRYSVCDNVGKEHLEKAYIGGAESINDPHLEREQCVMLSRCLAAKLLGILSNLITKPLPGVVYADGVESPADCYAKLLLFHLKSTSALQRLAVGLVITEWAKQSEEKPFQCPEIIKIRLLETLNESIYYDEIALVVTRMQQDCRDFVATLNHHKLPVDSAINLSAVITLEQARCLATTVFQSLIEKVKLKPKVLESLEDKRKTLLNVVTQASHDQLTLSIAVQAVMAGAVVAVGILPEKLNPVIKPLMDAIKKEENEILQRRAASRVSDLVQLCFNRTVCPNPKIVKNLCTYLTVDPYFTPHILPDTASSTTNKTDNQSITHVITSNNYSGILTLTNLQRNAETKANCRRVNSINRHKSLNAEVNLDELAVDDEVQHLNELQRRGAQFAFSEMAKSAGDSIREVIPSIWESMLKPLTNSNDAEELIGNDVLAQELVNSLQLLEVVGPSLHPDNYPYIEEYLPQLCACLEHPYTAVRHMAARCLGMLSKVMTVPTMSLILDKVLPSLDSMDSDRKRQGAIEVLSNIIDNLGFELVPYIVLLVVPVLGRMSDPNSHVRLMATHCFATLIRLMPLEGGVPNPPEFSLKLIEMKQKERRFLEQLFDTKTLTNYKVPVQIKAELRGYQQDGVNWLAFLNKYKLHGILCDDMGLGKTLQSICILAGDHYLREQEYKKNKKSEFSPLPSIVICPPTLTGHWVYEVEKFVSSKYLHPLHYTGPPAERQRLRTKAKKYNLIIASYDIVRNDIDFFGSIRWNYCILDEGHIIKNGKTKLSRAIKQLVANHRLILSGTPIQNNVLELWSLFDFLMPGFLGTEKQFVARYSKPILLSRDAKSSSKEQEAGALAMESLHRQVLPFLLRRLKEDVLKDLPPKIIQDYYCDLSPLQEQLYEDFSKSRARKNVDSVVTDAESNPEKSHIFQALQYLRKVCNHPKLVLTSSHPEFEKTIKKLQEQKMVLNDIRHAAKLPALKQLLMDCGIGVEFSGNDAGPVVNQHRALIFCQLKSMLDILEEDLFKTHLPNVSYLRLDGSIPPGSRYSVVHRFNTDPSIDVLLLTTQVGGLGLNLTGADTVIFVEHDWNPMKDLQAMDRAHRIGQKKVVNVYRLITKGTLEEKIMGLQRFKLTIANTVITQENSSLKSMGTDQLLDLFHLDSNRKNKDSSSGASTSKESSRGSGSKGLSQVFDFLPELWDEKQYELEYDLANFLQNLKK